MRVVFARAAPSRALISLLHPQILRMEPAAGDVSDQHLARYMPGVVDSVPVLPESHWLPNWLLKIKSKTCFTSRDGGI